MTLSARKVEQMRIGIHEARNFLWLRDVAKVGRKFMVEAERAVVKRSSAVSYLTFQELVRRADRKC